jgi:hypothetical protein
MKAILLAQITLSPYFIIFCGVCLTLIFSAMLLWLQKKTKLPGWLVSCVITSFFLTTSIGCIMIQTIGATESKITLAEFIPPLFALPPVFLLVSTFCLPAAIPLGLIFYFVGAKRYRAKQLTVVGCANTEHTGDTSTFASAFGTKKQLPPWKLLVASSVVALALVLAVRLPPFYSHAYDPVKPWASLWATQAQGPMNAMQNASRGCTEALTKWSRS